MTAGSAAATAGAALSSSSSSSGGTGRGKKRRSSKDAAQSSRDAASCSELSRYPGWSLSAAGGHSGARTDRDTHMVPLLRATLLSGAAAASAAPVAHFDACLWCVAATDIAMKSLSSPSSSSHHDHSHGHDRGSAPCGGADSGSFRLLHYLQLLRVLSVATAAGGGAGGSDSCDPLESLVVAAVALQLAGRLLAGLGRGRDGARSGRGEVRDSVDDGDGDRGMDRDRAKRRWIGDEPSTSSSPSFPHCGALAHPLASGLCLVAHAYFSLHLRSTQQGGGVPSNSKSHDDPASALSSVAAIAIADGKPTPSSSSSSSDGTGSSSGSQLHCVQAVALIATTHQQLVAIAREQTKGAKGKSNGSITVSASLPLHRRVEGAHSLLRLLVRAVAASGTDAASAPADLDADATADSLLSQLELAGAVVHCCRTGPLASLLRAQLLLVLGPEDVGDSSSRSSAHCNGKLAATATVTASSGTQAQTQALLLRTERLGCDLAQGLLADVVVASNATSTGSKDSCSGSGSDEGGTDLVLCRALQALVMTRPRILSSSDSGSSSSRCIASGLNGSINLSGQQPRISGGRTPDKALQDFLSFLET